MYVVYTVLHGGTLIDGNGNLIKDSVIIFQDEYIYEIGTIHETTIPNEAKHFDIKGKYVLPGLIDAHVHLDLHGMGDTYHESLVEDKLRTIRASIEMRNTIRAGVTTVRNAGSANYIDIAVKKAVEEGLITGPRILTSGKIICMMAAGNEYFKGLYKEADGVDENRKAAREQLKEGADILKVMATGAIMNPGGVPGAPHLNVEEIRAVVEEGLKMGKHTAAHAHGSEGIKNAIKAGVRTIEHGTLADDEALKMMADNSIYLISTLSSNFWMINATHKNGIPNFMFEKAEEISSIRKNNLLRALDKGVKVAVGTDAGTPYNYHGKNSMEIVQLVEQKIMSEMESIIAATKIAAEAIDLSTQIGTLEKGKLADCVVLNKSPLQDIRSLLDINNLYLIFKGGKLIKGEVDTSQWTPDSPLGLMT